MTERDDLIEAATWALIDYYAWLSALHAEGFEIVRRTESTDSGSS